MTTVDPWFPFPPRERPGAPRLFCFPHAGGGASAFRTWHAALPAANVWPVQPPGRENRLREPPCTDVAALVDALVPRLTPRLAGSPFALFGHSLGALVAYETARRLAALGLRPPALLVVSSSRAPHLDVPPPLLHPMDRAGLLAELRRLGGTPPAVLENHELMDALLPLLRADLRMSETYRAPAAPAAGVPILALGARNDAEVAGERLLAWEEVAAAGFESRWFEGGHFYLQERAAEVLRVVGRRLETLV